MAWNLEDYEDAATLNRWFIDNFPAGRVETRVEYFDAKDQEVVIRAEIYRDSVDTLPASSNFARGKASDYPGKMQRWYFEDTTTSAIGRALIILKGSSKTATKESMIQAKGDTGHRVKHPWSPPRSTAVTDPGLPSTFVAIEEDEVVVAKNEPEAPLWEETVTYLTESLGASPISDELKCSHGLMLVREGTSKAGKPYKGSMCGAKAKGDKCQQTLDGRALRDGALWWVQNNKGIFEIPRR